MSSVIKNGAKCLKKSFRDAPFVMGLIVYVLIIAHYWHGIMWHLYRFNVIVRWVFIIAVPVVLYLFEKLVKYNDKKKRILSFREHRVLPKRDLESIKSLLPDSQIDLFDSVLVPSLTLFYSAFLEISQEEYYQEKIELILKTIKLLKKQRGIYVGQTQNKCRDIAITAFVFYKVLFKGALERFNQYAGDHSYIGSTDTWVLIKRVPAKLRLLLEGQYWRLYEFQEAVYGSSANLQLNSDIAAFLVPFEDTSTETSKNKQETIPIAEAPEIAETKHEAVVEVKSQEHETQKNDVTANNIQQAETNEVSTESTKVSEKVTIADEFLKWLLKVVSGKDKRFNVNEGKYIYMSPINYGDEAAFVTLDLFEFYRKVSANTPASVMEALEAKSLLSSKKYAAVIDGKKIELMRIAIEKSEIVIHKKIDIVEVPSDEIERSS